MRWQGRKGSSQVEDRRGQTVGRGVRLGGWGILIVLIISFVTGTNPLELLSVISQTESSLPAPGSQSPVPRSPEEDPMAQMISVVLADTETTWTEVFAAEGQRYQLPKLVLFTDAVQSACGMNSAAVGPFYCPSDSTIYIDLSFYNELGSRFGAPGDFAQAYVIAHEVGHHVQNLLGISEQVSQEQRRAGQARANALSVRLELQADCLAGVWGNHAAKNRNLLEPGDVEEGMAAAAAIGDDRLQKQAGARVRPESFTHGTSEQRVHWFREGLQTGDSDRCDTFAQGSF